MLHLIFWEKFKMNNPTDNTKKEQKKEVEMLGEGALAAPEVVNIFKQLKLLK